LDPNYIFRSTEKHSLPTERCSFSLISRYNWGSPLRPSLLESVDYVAQPSFDAVEYNSRITAAGRAADILSRLMKHIAANWTKFRAISWPERRTLLAAMAWLPLFWLGLRVLGLRRFQVWLQRDNLPIESCLSLDEIVRIATLVNIAAQEAPVPATCLTRSLLLGWILRRRGVASELRIGVRLTQGVLDAHAWVACASIPINDRPDVGEQFAPFDKLLPLGAFQSP
jgi:hypothetical protein